MKHKTKWIKTICPDCGVRVPDSLRPENTPEPFVSLYPCDDCAHPEQAEAQRRAWEKTEHDILLMAARGELLDANGNPVPAIVCLQMGGGKYETRHYAVGSYGELVCTSMEVKR